MRETEVSTFTTHLAVEKKVASSNLDQAFNALVFLYREMLKKIINTLENVTRAKNPLVCRWFLPETKSALVSSHLDSVNWLMAGLPYEAGLRIESQLLGNNSP